MSKIKKIKLVNAKEISISSPDSFIVPPEELLNNLKIGSIVKVCDNRERFWVNIVRVKKNGYFNGKIDNFLMGNMMNEIIKEKTGKVLEDMDHNYGDIIEFHLDNIYDINTFDDEIDENSPEFKKYVKEVEKEYKKSLIRTGKYKKKNRK